MTAASFLPDVLTPTFLLGQFQTVKEHLIEACSAHTYAIQNVALAKREIERARADALVRGVEGKNEAVREAQLRLELESPYQALEDAEDALTEARVSLDAIRLEWDSLRYSLRCLEVAVCSNRNA